MKAAAAIRCGNVGAVAERFTLHCETGFKTERQNLAAVFVANLARERLKRQGRHTSNKQSKGGLQMLNSCIVFLALVLFGCFAAGSCEIASERAERKRIEREIREKYGRTY